jgi:hypothetical protein
LRVYSGEKYQAAANKPISAVRTAINGARGAKAVKKPFAALIPPVKVFLRLSKSALKAAILPWNYSVPVLRLLSL